MKIAIVTWISYLNYGTLLQAYSLQKILEEMGYESYVLSDEKILGLSSKNEYLFIKNRIINRFRANHYNLYKCAKVIVDEVQTILIEKNELSYYLSKMQCEKFKNNYITIDRNVNQNNLKLQNEKYDCFICGSDQIWSILDYNFNGYYFLNFVTKNKIAYAASLGTEHIPLTKVSIIKEWLRDFIAISLREKLSCQQIESITQKQVEWVLDPTLLHSTEWWTKFCKTVRVQKRQYLLCYFLENKSWYMCFAKKLSNKLRMPLIIIPNNPELSVDNNCSPRKVGPVEFVSLFRDATYILTDSYHGSIFSIVFKKNFLYLKRFNDLEMNNQNIRIKSLFGYLDINDLIIDENDLSDFKDIDYDNIDIKLMKLRSDSVNYLMNSISKCI